LTPKQLAFRTFFGRSTFSMDEDETVRRLYSFNKTTNSIVTVISSIGC